MLQIRAAQMTTLEHDLLVRRITNYLEMSYPPGSFPPKPAGRRSLVENAVRQASARGYRSTDSLLNLKTAVTNLPISKCNF